MNVIEDRHSLGKLLQREIGSEYTVVPSPDHPLLLKGPDILIGGAGNLTAIYIPAVYEVRKDASLRARYILSRLALPASTRHLLIHRGDRSKVNASLSKQFAIDLKWEERLETSTIAKDAGFIGRQNKIPSDIIHKTRERFAESYSAIQKSRRLVRFRKYSSVEKRLDHESRARLVNVGQVIDDVRENFFEGEILPLPTVKSLITKKTNESFALEEGIPMQKSDSLSIDLATIGDVADFRGDPEKPIRAAAFSGWVLLEDLPREQQASAAMHIRKRSWARSRK